jgi:branched-chain amino acid transport system permease protein
MILQQLANALSLSGIYILFAVGLSLGWGMAKILNLAYGAMFMLAAFVAYLVSSSISLSFWALLPLAMLTGGAVCVIAETLAFRPIRRAIPDRHQAELGMLIASIGVSSIIVGAVQNMTRAEVKNLPPGTFPLGTIVLGGVRITNLQIVVFVLSMLLTAAIGWWVARTRTGRALRAVAYSPETSALLGVNSDRVTLLVMFVSGLVAGGAGLLLAVYFSAVDAHMGDGLLLKAFAIIILGGIGSIPGTIVGGFLLAFAETFTAAYVSTAFKDAIAFAFILIVLLVRPEGLFSRGRFERA